MSETSELARECTIFARYLSGAEAGEYVVAKYVAAHEAGVVERQGTSSFERAVVAIARRGPWLARAMDSHARVFANGSLIRRKLVLVLAILETKAPQAEAIDAPSAGTTLGMFVRMAWFAAVFALHVLVAALLLLPVRVACAFGGGE